MAALAPLAYPYLELAPLRYPVVGVDVSNHQGKIDWEAPVLKASASGRAA